MSLLWKIATTQGVEMMPLVRILDLHSTDHPGRVRDAWEHLDAEHAHYPWEPSPDESVSSLAESMRKGETPAPVRILHAPDGKDYLADGHHRALAAEQAGLSHLPVEHEWLR